MDKKYRDKAKPKKPRLRTMSKESPSSIVRVWVSNNRGRSFTKQEIIEELPMLTWGQIYAILTRMKKRWQAYLKEYARHTPYFDPKETHEKLIEGFFNFYYEAPIQFNPDIQCYEVLDWENKIKRDTALALQHSKAQVRSVTEMRCLREPTAMQNPELMDSAHILLSKTSGELTDGLHRHTCGRLIGGSMKFCPQCGERIT